MKLLDCQRRVLILVLAAPLNAEIISARINSVTPVHGASWLTHLNRSFDISSMGRTGSVGPPPVIRGEDAWQAPLLPGFSPPVVRVTGADLFRWNCQACHNASGRGAPPEINSVIDPVRATSVQVISQRMKVTGSVDRRYAAELARQSKALIMQRLHEGGQDMPAPCLDEAEVASVFAYLEQLANVPGAEKRQIVLTESPYRVGEQIVKATCHTCHGAAGANPTPQQLLNGAIPPLNTLTRRVSLSGLLQKVTAGAPVTMGTPPMPYRGRMPVLRHLTPDDATAVYQYLQKYPPQ